MEEIDVHDIAYFNQGCQWNVSLSGSWRHWETEQSNPGLGAKLGSAKGRGLEAGAIAKQLLPEPEGAGNSKLKSPPNSQTRNSNSHIDIVGHVEGL
jgi:hypothetical protein